MVLKRLFEWLAFTFAAVGLIIFVAGVGFKAHDLVVDPPPIPVDSVAYFEVTPPAELTTIRLTCLVGPQ